MVSRANAVLSRAKKTRGIPSSAINLRSPEGGPSAVADGDGAPGGSAPGPFPPPDGGQPPAAGLTHRQASRRALKNWKVRSRLFLLVVIPTVTAVAAGAIFIASSVQSALVYGRVQTLANLSGKITGLVQALQTERQDTVRFIVLGSTNGGRGAKGARLGLLNHDYAITTGWSNQVKTLAGQLDGSYSTLAQQDTQAAATAIGNLPAIRTAATGTQLPALIVIGEYATAINALLAVESQIAVGSSDSTLAGSVRVLGLVSSMKEQASQQQALLTSALSPDLVSLAQFGPAQQAAITDAQAQQRGNLNDFTTAATPEQHQLLNNVLSNPNVALAEAQEQQAISLASSQSPIATDPTISDASSSLAYVVTGMRSVEEQFASSVISRSGSLHGGAITSALVFSLAVALLLGIALVATILIGRSMVGPLRRLRNGAFEVAGTRLPEMVRRMSESDGEGGLPPVEPIDVDSSDEIGEVARAFDQVHMEAVRLAANEAALRGNVNAMFVNLSRRSQSMIERQIRMITRLEQGEQDSKRLASLFQMDHLATRMRRNSENLLVLAGHELSRRGSRPVALVDVLRAAASEIEQYERVTLNVQPGVSVRTEAVSDVVHLTAELAENATSFSAAGTPVTIAAQMQGNGWTLIEIADQGVGMGPEDMAQANLRLSRPPVVDVAVSRRMGLFVVARLAGRHGIRVRLCPVPSGGLIAQIWLPSDTVVQETSTPGPRRSVSMASGNQAATATVATDLRPAGVGENGHAMPMREAGRTGLAPVASVPRPALPREEPAPAAPAAGASVRNDDPRTATGPRPRLGDRMRAVGLGAGAVPRDPEPVQGGRDQRGGELYAAGTGDYSGSGGYASSDGYAGTSGYAGAGGFTGGADGLAGRAGTTPPAQVPAAPVPVSVSPGEVIVPPVPVSASPGEVIVPSADSLSDRERLPIFDSVESHWFSRGGQVTGTNGQGGDGWSSSADAGWRAAEVAHAPSSDGTTPTGLPRRQPQANLVPGTAAATAASAAPLPSGPGRSAEETRDRFARFQRGIQQGRAAATGVNPFTGEGTTS
jgi:signal transduction histidine kinase